MTSGRQIRQMTSGRQGPERDCRQGPHGTSASCSPRHTRNGAPSVGDLLAEPLFWADFLVSAWCAPGVRLVCAWFPHGPAQRPEKNQGFPGTPQNPPDSAFPGRCQPPEFQRRFREKRTWMRSEFNSEPFHPETSSGIPSSSPGIATGSRGSQGRIRQMTTRCLLKST